MFIRARDAPQTLVLVQNARLLVTPRCSGPNARSEQPRMWSSTRTRHATQLWSSSLIRMSTLDVFTLLK